MLNIDIKNHRPLREIVYEELKMQILKGRIAPGTRIMEVEMAEQMGVSRTPIREAIRKLEKEGLVTIEPRKGAYASQLSEKDMEEIIEVRENVEGLAAYYAALRITDEQRIALEKVCNKFDQAVQEGNTADMIKYDTAFHHQITESTGNQILVHIMEMLQELVLRFRYLYYEDFKRGEKMPEEHHRVMEAILGGNAEEAKAAAYDHIERLQEIVHAEPPAEEDEA